MTRVLIIEKDKQVRESLCRHLGHEGYLVSEAGKGSEGIRLHRKKSFDLIITGLFLPYTEGLETILKFSRESDSKIIAISSGIGSLTMARRMGAHRSFSIPFDVREVADAAAELLGEKQ